MGQVVADIRDLMEARGAPIVALWSDRSE